MYRRMCNLGSDAMAGAPRDDPCRRAHGDRENAVSVGSEHRRKVAEGEHALDTSSKIRWRPRVEWLSGR